MHDALPDVVIASVVHDEVDFAGTWQDLKWYFERALFREFDPSDVPILVKFPPEAEARCLARQKCFGTLRDVISPIGIGEKRCVPIVVLTYAVVGPPEVSQTRHARVVGVLVVNPVQLSRAVGDVVVRIRAARVEKKMIR